MAFKLIVLLVLITPCLVNSLTSTPGIKVTNVDRYSTFSGWPNVTRAEPIEIEAETPVLLRLKGAGLTPDLGVVFTNVLANRGEECNHTSFVSPVFKLSTAETLTKEFADVKVTLKKLNSQHSLLDTAYVCVRETHDQRWFHQGEKVKIRITKTLTRTIHTPSKVSIYGIRAEGDRVYLWTNGVTNIPADQETIIRLSGNGFRSKMLIALTTVRRRRGGFCDDLPLSAVYSMQKIDIATSHIANLKVTLGELEDEESVYYFCTKEPGWELSREINWVHQGDEEWVQVRAEGRFIPIWLQIWLIIFLQIMSGLFSGLNLGLMALDNTELRIIAKCGTPEEKEFARVISPLRKRGNYLLCSIVLGNVLVNSVMTVLLDDLTSGLVAIIGSTIGIVIFGEIIPQAICSRHALAVGARTVWITKLFMVLTFPMSYPVSKILDWVLGDEIANVYDREKLMEYIQVTKDYNKLGKEEMNMISGALELKSKTASEIMTKVEDVFMIPINTILNFENITEIVGKGFTRVPCYDTSRDDIVALLHTKDLALVDPDDNTPLKTVCEFYNHPIIYVFHDETLHLLLNEFKKGRSHMACVRIVDEASEGDPQYKIVGVVTLEDVIEEIIQAEIMDETDILTDNRRKQRRKGAQVIQDYSDFVKIGSGQGKSIVSPQLALAAFQFLSTCVEPFKKSFISESVLRRLLSQNIFFMLKYRHHEFGGVSNGSSTPIVTIYKTGKMADYFVLILEGKVKVTAGKERLIYEAGPFSYFGVQAIAMSPLPPAECQSAPRGAAPSSQPYQLDRILQTSPYVPDFTVVAVSDLVYMKVPRAIYGTALKATLMERQHRHDASIEECFNSLTLGGTANCSKPRTSSFGDLKDPPPQLSSPPFLLTSKSRSVSICELKESITTCTTSSVSPGNSLVDISDVCTSEYIITSGSASSFSRID